MNEVIIIKNGTLLTDGLVRKADILLKDGLIESIEETVSEDAIPENAHIIDATGKYVSPGFIDMHVHGGAGADFMDGDIDSYRTAINLHTSHGTTLIFPTTLSSTTESLFNAVKAYAKIKKAGLEGARMGGLHLEGPYFSYAKRGAQDPRYLSEPNPEEYLALIEMAAGDIVRWSLAPELPGALEMAEALSGRGVVMAMGHTDATFEDCETAFRAGFTHMTHFFSCMSTVVKDGINRKAGAVEYGYYNDDVTVEIIGDGVHIPASLLKLIYKIKGPGAVALITDAVRPAGFSEGRYTLGIEGDGLGIVIEDGVAKLEDRSSLAGSVVTMDKVVRTVHELTGLPLAEVVQSATATPARIMGYADSKGSLKPGYDADIVLFDEDVTVSHVIVGGRLQRI